MATFIPDATRHPATPGLYFRPAPDPAAHLTPSDLATIFRPLRRDYCRQIVATAQLPNKQRHEAIRARLEVYSEALAAMLADAHEDAETALRDLRSRGVWR